MSGKNPELIWERLSRLIEEVNLLYERKSYAVPSPNITFAQLRILNCIKLSPGGSVRLKEIANALQITAPAVSQIVERMVQQGMIERIQSRDDRRSVEISLSGIGRECHAHNNCFFDKLFDKLLVKVSPEKEAVFLEVLDHLILAIKNEKLRSNHL